MISIDTPPPSKPIIIRRQQAVNAFIHSMEANGKVPANYMVICSTSSGEIRMIGLVEWLNSGHINYNMMKGC